MEKGIIAAAAALLIAGCATQPSPWRQYLQNQVASLNLVDRSCALQKIAEHAKSMPIPVPVKTPYDVSPSMRQQYVSGFSEGWRFAVSGQLTRATPAHIGQTPSWIEGFWAGTKEYSDPMIEFLEKTK